MDYKNDIFNLLKKRCYDLINSKFILSSNKIKSILEWIVINPSLYEFVKQCSNGIDFRSELSKCITLDEKGNKGFVLPNSNRYKITIVLGILYDLDSNRISLNNLLNELFYPANIDESFEMFARNIILPFLDSIENLYINNIEPEVEDSTEKDNNIGNNSIDFEILLNNIELDLKDFNTTIKGDNDLDEREMNEYTLIIEGLYHSIIIGDILMIKAMYVALHNTITAKRYKTKIKIIDNALHKAMII